MRSSHTIKSVCMMLACALSLFAGSAAIAGALTKTAASGEAVSIIAEDSTTGSSYYVERRIPNGELNYGHGVRGLAPFTMGTDNEPPAGLVLDEAGRVLIMGATRSPKGRRQPVVLRLLPTGQPDPSWGTDGRSTEAPATGNARALDAMPLRDGSVLVVGTVELNGEERAAAWHLRADGRLDTRSTRSSRFVLASPDASRAVSLTALDDGKVMLAVRVQTDADVLLEAHSFDPGDADAMPKLVTRQPWPPAWSEEPVWAPSTGAPRWADPNQAEAAIAAVKITTAVGAASWKPLAPGVAEAEPATTEPGGAAFTPFGERDKPRTEPAGGEADSYWWAWLAVGAIALAAAVARAKRRPAAGDEESEE
jgi:hypothetical protein